MFTLSQNPFFANLEDAHNILIIGAGGGFDFYQGVPLYLALKQQGKKVYLANLSFTDLKSTDAKKFHSVGFEINAQTKGLEYFPEKYLCEYFANQGIDLSVFAFSKTGVLPLKSAYQKLIQTLALDTIILVDGGTDSLMFGDESGLGTPTLDSTSIVALNLLDEIKNKFLVSIGFGADHFHGVSHYQVLENIAQLTQENAYLGCFSLLSSTYEGLFYLNLIKYVNQKMHPMDASIVSNSIASAMEGYYGNYHKTPKTQNSELWISPLMQIYWCFLLEGIAKRLLYYNHIKDTRSMQETKSQIEKFRDSIIPKERKQIPL